MCMWTGCSLDSGFTLKFTIFCSSKTANKCASKMMMFQLFAVTLEEEMHGERCELLAHGTHQCAILKALSPAKGSRDWYYIHTVICCY